MVSKKYICIICPNSCEIEVDHDNEKNEIRKISGNICEKGEEYVRKEIFCPERGLTTTIAVRNGSLPLVSVKTSKPISKYIITRVMDEISDLEIEAPVSIGDVIVHNILNTGVDIIATRNINKKVK